MRGVPLNPVPCTFPGGCSEPAYPSTGRCNKHQFSAVKKYQWTPAQEDQLRRIYEQNVHHKPSLGRELGAFARRLGWPRHAIKNKAQWLGLTSDIRTFWTQQEVDFLREHAGSKSVRFLKKSLGRGYTSVVSKIEAMQLSRRVVAGYSRAELSKVFGVSLKIVREWIERGWLRPAPGTDRIPESQVRRFIRLHPEEYSLKRVDEPWLKGILFPGTFGTFGRSSAAEAA